MFAMAEEPVPVINPEANGDGENKEAPELELDPRNFERGIGFIDVIGYKIKVREGDELTQPW